MEVLLVCREILLPQLPFGQALVSPVVHHHQVGLLEQAQRVELRLRLSQSDLCRTVVQPSRPQSEVVRKEQTAEMRGRIALVAALSASLHCNLPFC